MTRSRPRLALAAACVLAIAATACSSSGGSSSGSSAPTTTAGAAAASAGGATIAISNSTFGSYSATAGSPITITNSDSRPHTVTDDKGSFDVNVDAGGTATLTIPTAGTYKIHCKIHSAMHGTITVA
jgi:plastocyanin